jgi:hypothetical protein
MLSDEERAAMLRKCATCLAENLETMTTPEQKIEYLTQILHLYSDIALLALNFSLDMTLKR